MSSEDYDQPGHKRAIPPNHLLFVSSDGLHHTLKRDVRAHVSRYIRREARSRAKTAKKDEGDLVVLAPPSRSSLDSWYDSTSLHLPQDNEAGPLKEGREQHEPMTFPDEGLTRDLQVDGNLYPSARPVRSFPLQGQHMPMQSAAGAAYIGGKPGMQLARQSTFLQTDSLWIRLTRCRCH